MGGACSTYGGKVHTEFWWRNLKERDNLEDPDVDGSSGSGIGGHGLD